MRVKYYRSFCKKWNDITVGINDDKNVNNKDKDEIEYYVDNEVNDTEYYFSGKNVKYQ